MNCPVCIDLIIDRLYDSEFDAADAHAADLLAWLNGDGFTPQRPKVEECQYLAVYVGPEVGSLSDWPSLRALVNHPRLNAH